MQSPTSSSPAQYSGKAVARFTALESGESSRVPSSGTTNLPAGVLSIYRDISSQEKLEAQEAANSLQHEASTGITLAVLAVPSYMTPSDFLSFVEPVSEGITHLRIIRDSFPNRSIVVMRMRTLEDAENFSEAYNGKPFNSMEPEICQVVRVTSLRIDVKEANSTAFLRPLASASSAYELPTCPVCLDRLDSAVTGLVTVPCSHTFHCMCLSKWGDSRCPVCRYSQKMLSSQPSSSHALAVATSSLSVNQTQCADCSSTSNLWICLVCGNVGCGRYGRAHAHAHYQLTSHLYALELETQRVWDYAGDGYVHRLIQNKADGKLVELPSASVMASTGSHGNSTGPSAADALNAEKIEAIGIEYSYLLTSQLDSQRGYYEEQIDELRRQLKGAQSNAERALLEKETITVRTAQEYERQRVDHQKRLDDVSKERDRTERKSEKIAALAKQLQQELRDERAVSEGLLANLSQTQSRVNSNLEEKGQLKSKITDLEDQVRDLMFFLQAKDQITQDNGIASEAAGGSIEIHVPEKSSQSKGRKPRK